MQIAKGTVILSPENLHYKRDVTPAEVLILHKLHFKNANGSPLHSDFVICGEAITVDVAAKPAEPAYLDVHLGRTLPEKPAVAAKTHKRTNLEEILRLRKKYTGQIDGKTVFEVVFGNASIIQLPQTFEEIQAAVGTTFKTDDDEPAAPNSDATSQFAHSLRGKKRHELVEIAIEKGVRVDVTDENATIIHKLVAAHADEEEENKTEVRIVPDEANDGGRSELEGKKRAELVEIAEKMGIKVDAAHTKAIIIDAILAKSKELEAAKEK